MPEKLFKVNAEEYILPGNRACSGCGLSIAYRYVLKALRENTILTLPATGSEANGNSVISRKATQEKLYFYSPHVFPRFSVLDPETTFSLPAKQLRNGIVDAFIDPPDKFAHVNGLGAHAEIGFKKVRANDASGDTHGYAAHCEVGGTT